MYKGHNRGKVLINLAKFGAGDTHRYAKQRTPFRVWFNLLTHDVDVLPQSEPGCYGCVPIIDGIYPMSSQEIVDAIEEWYEAHIQIFTALSD